MFRAVCRSSSGAPTVLAASGLHTHAVTARSQVWVGSHLLLTLDSIVTAICITPSSNKRLYLFADSYYIDVITRIDMRNFRLSLLWK